MLLKLCLFCMLAIYKTKSEDYCRDYFDNCICTDIFVECHNEAKLNGDITKLFHYIKDSVTTISVTGCNLKELPKNTFGSCRGNSSLSLHNLKTVDLSNNRITTIHGQSFQCLPNLLSLDLSDNEWEIDESLEQTGYFSSLASLKHLDLTNTFSEIWDAKRHITKLAKIFNETNMAALKTLKLAYNKFNSLSLSDANSFCQLKYLKTLDLSHNHLVAPSLPNKPDCLKYLETLDLSFNHMLVLQEEFMDHLKDMDNLKNVKLDNNPFRCDCRLVETWKWLNLTHMPIKKQNLKCAAGIHSSHLGKPILSLSLSDLECVLLGHPFSSVLKAITFIFLAIIVFILIAILVFHSEKVKLVCKKWRKKVPNLCLRSHQGYNLV